MEYQPDDYLRRRRQPVRCHLINVGAADRGFRTVYGDTNAEGQYERRNFDCKLLLEVPGDAHAAVTRARSPVTRSQQEACTLRAAVAARHTAEESAAPGLQEEHAAVAADVAEKERELCGAHLHHPGREC